MKFRTITMTLTQQTSNPIFSLVTQAYDGGVDPIASGE